MVLDISNLNSNAPKCLVKNIEFEGFYSSFKPDYFLCPKDSENWAVMDESSKSSSYSSVNQPPGKSYSSQFMIATTNTIHFKIAGVRNNQ
jgi:hypothetical protein